MSVPTENETWLIDTGDLVIKKEHRMGKDSLLPWEVLVYCLWVADYGMRNAGDLDTAADVCSGFHTDAKRIAAELALPLTTEAFSLSKEALETEYFDRFESICDEIKRAKPDGAVEYRSRRKKPST
jgi:hypothetical protein